MVQRLKKAKNDTVLDKKLEENDPWNPCNDNAISPKWNGAVSHKFQKAPFGPSRNCHFANQNEQHHFVTYCDVSTTYAK
jgi:hypothetical protein